MLSNRELLRSTRSTGELQPILNSFHSQLHGLYSHFCRYGRGKEGCRIVHLLLRIAMVDFIFPRNHSMQDS